MIGDFHFLRPWWLLALVGAALLVFLITRRGDARTRWKDLIAPHLLAPLLIGQQGRRRKRRRRGGRGRKREGGGQAAGSATPEGEGAAGDPG